MHEELEGETEDPDSMIIKMRTISVHELPGKVTAPAERAFLRQLQPHLETERPRLVLDCSRVARMDKAAMHLLLSCLEEVMKRNGDVKLASLRPEAEAVLGLAGVQQLFESYSTTAEAVHSFHRHRMEPALPALENGGLGPESENAA